MDKVYFYLQILFYTHFQKTEYYCFPVAILFAGIFYAYFFIDKAKHSQTQGGIPPHW